MKPEESLGRKLKRKKFTLAIAESCTGGLLASRITDVAGSSSYFKLGVVAYSNEFKKKILKVPPKALDEFGAVSGIVAHQMAKSIMKIAKSDIGVGITGIAGPSGGTKDKPVGLVYISIVFKKKNLIEYKIFKGTRTNIKKKVVDRVFKIIDEIL